METATITLNKGMNMDINPRFMPEGQYRQAWNMVLETEDGDLGSISNEKGTTLLANTGYIIIGSILTDTAETIIFTTDNTNSEIGILDTDTGTYTTLINDTCLNFKTY